MGSISMLVNLSCNHVGNFTPTPKGGDLVWCYRCQNWREFVEVILGEPVYRVRCTSCHYPRSFGADKNAAYLAANRHLSRHPSHKIRITFAGKLHGEVSNETDELPTVQWVQSNPEHQGSLRELILAKQAKQTNSDKPCT